MNTSSAVSSPVGTELSLKAYKAGGELVRILSDPQEVARYAHAELTTLRARDIGEFVAGHDHLNTEAHVGSLIWLASYHGISMSDVEDLIDDHGAKYVYLAFDFLVEVGERTDAGSIFVGGNEATFVLVADIVQLLGFYHETNYSKDREIATVESLNMLIDSLGGLEKIVEFSDAKQLEEALSSEVDFDDDFYSDYDLDGDTR